MKLSEKQLIIHEREYSPNRSVNFTLHCLTVLFAFLLLAAYWLDEMRPDAVTFRIGGAIALGALLLPQLLMLKKSLLYARFTKYVTLFCLFVFTAVITTTLNFHATLFLLLPMLLAMQYQSRAVGIFALISSLLCTVAAPVISFLMGWWDVAYLEKLLNYCSLTVSSSPVQLYAAMDSLENILLRMALPHAVMVLLTALAMFHVISHSKRTLKARLAALHSTRRISNIQYDLLEGMACVIESRDGTTGTHVINTKKYVSLMLDYILEHHLYPDLVTPEYADILKNAALMHDVGKIAIPDTVLRKPGRYTEEDYKAMQEHPKLGSLMLERAFAQTMDRGMLNTIREVVETHHENWDGSGYPRGLVGSQTPLGGRITAVADVFDAMVARRQYKEGLPVSVAYDFIEGNAGVKFDPDVVRIFLAIRPQVEQYLRQRGEMPPETLTPDTAAT